MGHRELRERKEVQSRLAALEGLLPMLREILEWVGDGLYRDLPCYSKKLYVGVQ